MMQAFITWNPNPVLFSFGELSVRWYGLLFGTGFILSYLMLGYIFKKEHQPPALIDKLAIYIFIATVTGARLGHCLLYEPEIYLADPVRILKIWEGGLASHGAAIMILIALIIFSKKYKKNMSWLFDRIAIVIPIVASFIRTGNLMNSELVGRPASVPWAFIFSGVDNIPRHPVQLYEAVAYLLIFAALATWYFVKGEKVKLGQLSSLFLITLFSARFLLEFYKANQINLESHMLLNMGQALSIPFIILGIILLIISSRKKQKESGQPEADNAYYN